MKININQPFWPAIVYPFLVGFTVLILLFYEKPIDSTIIGQTCFMKSYKVEILDQPHEDYANVQRLTVPFPEYRWVPLADLTNCEVIIDENN